MMTFDEYVSYYEKHAGKLKLNPRYNLVYDPEHGFSEFAISGNYLLAGSMCGDFDYWISMARYLCKKHNLVSMTTFTARNVKAYIRRIGFKITDTYLGRGMTDYHAVNKIGERLLAEQVDGGYILTWEVK